MKSIKSVRELKQLCCGETLECFIRLNYGLKSSKEIEWDPLEDAFSICNLIDGTEEIMSTKELEKSNIGRASKKGALYAEDN